jgi:hypothetical protein
MSKTHSPGRGSSGRRGRSSRQSSSSSPLTNSAPARRNRSDVDDRDEDELEIFRRRAEWWRLYHGDPSGVLSSNLRAQAIAHAEKLVTTGLDNPDPGGARPKGSFELVERRGKGISKKPKGVRGQNPRPRSSFGFTSDAIEVRGPQGIALQIADTSDDCIFLDPEKRGNGQMASGSVRAIAPAAPRRDDPASSAVVLSRKTAPPIGRRQFSRTAI